MPREKPNYREMCDRLEEKFGKSLLSKQEAAQYLGVCYNTLQKKIAKGELKEDCCGKIILGSLANHLCG